jgi:transposase InsO family protein
LLDEGIRCGRKRVARLVRENNLEAKAARRFKVITTNSKHKFPVAPNVLDQNFMAEDPDRIWLSDITYVPTAEGWLYLAAVMDLYSRRIVGGQPASSTGPCTWLLRSANRCRNYCITRTGVASMPARIIRLC